MGWFTSKPRPAGTPRQDKDMVKSVTYVQRNGRQAKTLVTPQQYGQLRKMGRIVKDNGGWK
jgi:hypothetical protein